MAQQQIITKPYVEELQDNDSLFINHDGALRQIKKSDADFASGADMRAEVAAREAFETSVGGQMSEKANVDGYYEEMTVGDAEQLVATQFVEDNEPYLFRSTGGSSDVGNRAYLNKIVGGTVAWNQLVQNGNFADTSAWSTVGTLTVANNIGSYLASIQFGKLRYITNFIANHKYLQIFNTRADSVFDIYYGINGGGINNTNYPYSTTTSWQNVAHIWQATETSEAVISYILDARQSDWTTVQIKNAMLFDLTQMFGSTIADYIYSLEQATAGAGVAWFKKLFPNDYYPYNAGELLSVEGLQSHDIVGFNQCNETPTVGWFFNDAGTITKDRSTQFGAIENKIRCVPSTQYCVSIPNLTPTYNRVFLLEYDANDNFIGRQISDIGTNKKALFTTSPNAYTILVAFYTASEGGVTYTASDFEDFCINLSNPSRNGEYEPCEKHSYPLDSSLTLRGIPKLDASNNLYYDGDEYTSDGKVKRKYGIVDLGTLTWNWRENRSHWITYLPSANIRPKFSSNAVAINGLSNKYIIDTGGNVYNNTNPMSLGCEDGNKFTCFNGSDTEKPSGYLVYELTTPTTETAEPFQFTQIIDDFGTEEFVSNGFIPAGHVTRYPANLRDKLQHLPDLASMDGTYLIQQSGKQMSLVYMPAVFPETPTEDGTYTLKTVVTGGVATLQWVVE